MGEEKEPYVPTRRCPHRWCAPLHVAPAPFALAIFAFQLWNNWIFLAVAVIGSVMMHWTTKIINFRPQRRSGPVTVKDVMLDLKESPSDADLALEDARYEGTGWRVLEVRKGWARVAVGCDMFIVAVVGLATASTFTEPDKAAGRVAEAQMDISMVIGIVAVMPVVGFLLYAHKKATQPRKPKRVWLPAFLRTTD